MHAIFLPALEDWLNLTLLAATEVALLAAGGVAAHRLVRRVGRGERRLVLMVSVAIWLVLFGMVPFFAFALFAPTAALPAGGPGPGGHHAGLMATLVLNLVPFTLVASPALGVTQALAGRQPPAPGPPGRPLG